MAGELLDVVLERRGQEGGAPVGEKRCRRKLGVEVFETMAAQVVAELAVGSRPRKERVPRSHQLVREAGRGQVVHGSDRAAEHLVALQHADAPALSREQRGTRQGVDTGTHEDRVKARHGAEHTRADRIEACSRTGRPG